VYRIDNFLLSHESAQFEFELPDLEVKTSTPAVNLAESCPNDGERALSRRRRSFWNLLSSRRSVSCSQSSVPRLSVDSTISLDVRGQKETKSKRRLSSFFRRFSPSFLKGKRRSLEPVASLSPPVSPEDCASHSLPDRYVSVVARSESHLLRGARPTERKRSRSLGRFRSAARFSAPRSQSAGSILSDDDVSVSSSFERSDFHRSNGSLHEATWDDRPDAYECRQNYESYIYAEPLDALACLSEATFVGNRRNRIMAADSQCLEDDNNNGQFNMRENGAQLAAVDAASSSISFSCANYASDSESLVERNRIITHAAYFMANPRCAKIP
jgi:hypothetical protein